MPHRHRFIRLARATALVLAATAVFAAAALAATSPTQTREGYAAAVEPICKTDTQANERLLAGVEQQVKQGKLKPAGAQFGKAATAFAKARGQIARVPQPVDDAARLTKWLGLLAAQETNLRKISQFLTAGKKGAAQGELAKLEVNRNQANNAVLPFEFKYCRIERSTFN
jgi:hypothetical protein